MGLNVDNTQITLNFGHSFLRTKTGYSFHIFKKQRELNLLLSKEINKWIQSVNKVPWTNAGLLTYSDTNRAYTTKI